MSFFDKVSHLCEERGLSLSGMCIAAGIPKNTFTELKSGRIKTISAKNIGKIAAFFNVPTDYLMNDKRTLTPNLVPVYGQVSAGIPMEAITDIEDYEEIPDDMAASGEYIALKIHGHSMEPRMCEGDVVIARVQEDVEDGQYAIVMVNGDNATCKRVKKLEGGGIALLSTNPLYEPQYYSASETSDTPVRILGRVVEIRCKM